MSLHVYTENVAVQVAPSVCETLIFTNMYLEPLTIESELKYTQPM